MTRDHFDSLSVADVVSLCGINYSEHTSYVSLCCPYHNEANPSSVIYLASRMFKCFACKKARRLEGFYFDQTGDRVSDGEPTLFRRKIIRSEKALPKWSDDLRIEGTFTELWDNPQALDYIAKRNIPENFIFDFNVTSAMEMMKVYRWFEGMQDEDKGPIMRKRLMIPIIENGQIVSYEGRDYTGNARAKVFYPKGVENPLFNIDNLDSSEILICVEGLIDLAIIYGYGWKNVTTFMGVNISPKQKAQLQRFNRVILFLDGDEVGESVMDTFEDFHNGEHLVTRLSGDRDPKYGSYLEIKTALESAISPAEFLVKKFNMFETTRPSLF